MDPRIGLVCVHPALDFVEHRALISMVAVGRVDDFIVALLQLCTSMVNVCLGSKMHSAIAKNGTRLVHIPNIRQTLLMLTLRISGQQSA